MVRIIGIAGTAKNTGKTTATTAIMTKAYEEGLKLGLTTIGYDGEILDNVTGLPKPRINVKKGTIVAIAKDCLPVSTAVVEIKEETDISTAMGKIIVGEVVESGLIVIAGPNKSIEVKKVNAYLENYGCELIIVDGAINRIAPMVETHGLVLATGAACTTNIKKLANQTKAITDIFNTPIWQERNLKKETFSSILNEAMAEDFLKRLSDNTQEIEITGIIGEKSLEYISTTGKSKLKGRRLIFADPIKILVTANPVKTLEIFEEMKDTEVVVKKDIRILAVTMNPFYPKYRFVSHDYESAFVDKNEMKKTMLSTCNVPIIDIMTDGVEVLWPKLKIE